MIQIFKPCRGRITQWFANRQSHDGRKHTGNDYGYYAPTGVTDEVFAAADGVVQFAGDSRTLGWPNRWYINPDFDRSDKQDSSAGNFIAITHTQGNIKFDTTYSHLAAWTVKAGDYVKAGQRIATIGATGFSAGKHLHFELLMHPLNFNTDTYGRSDPNPHIVTGGLAAMGTITSSSNPSEEDDVVTAEDRTAIAKETAEMVYGWVLKEKDDKGAETGHTANLAWYLLSRAGAVKDEREHIADAVWGKHFIGTDGQLILPRWILESFHGILADQRRMTAEAAARLVAEATGQDPAAAYEAIATGVERALEGVTATVTLGAQDGK